MWSAATAMAVRFTYRTVRRRRPEVATATAPRPIVLVVCRAVCDAHLATLVAAALVFFAALATEARTRWRGRTHIAGINVVARTSRELI